MFSVFPFILTSCWQIIVRKKRKQKKDADLAKLILPRLQWWQFDWIQTPRALSQERWPSLWRSATSSTLWKRLWWHRQMKTLRCWYFWWMLAVVVCMRLRRRAVDRWRGRHDHWYNEWRQNTCNYNKGRKVLVTIINIVYYNYNYHHSFFKHHF